MLLRESIHKTRILLHKTLQNLKSFFFGRYQKLPKPHSFNPFSCVGGNQKDRRRDQFYINFCDEWEAELNKAKERNNISILVSKEPIKEENTCSGGSFMKFEKQSPVKSKQEGVVKEKKNKGSPQLVKGEEMSPKSMNGGGQELAEKMKEWDMINATDVDQVLDIEEAIHYYSRLTSPVYVDIVDKFFTDMYTEFSVPQASVSINNSKRKFGSIRL